MNCVYCGKGFSCGCQKTRTPDGKPIHKSCLTAYNNSKKAKVDPLTAKINKAKRNF